ncbi:hypothetical protein FOPG_00678 [Fusarium oxysporum f. sp. conglutinans race 2 54008]|uniref:Uncharacterized protein n=1 Tax=Fusarium oxysporum f. sp. conglutinans race 2 54008 TaxID=1089457 RepID=X0IWA2_FUSOX|nr:hypothetical protein FOPG_00678 [Fusarium oxysporum f. sp. conglutinans race 2 54008]
MRLCICVNLTYNQNYPHAAQSFMTSKSLALAVQAAQAPWSIVELDVEIVLIVPGT